MIIKAIPPRPMILYGAAWKNTFEQFVADFDEYIPQHDRHHIHYAADIQAVQDIINSIPSL
jgi:hypothetical protein